MGLWLDYSFPSPGEEDKKVLGRHKQETFIGKRSHPPYSPEGQSYLLWVRKQEDLGDGCGRHNGVECWKLSARRWLELHFHHLQRQEATESLTICTNSTEQMTSFIWWESLLNFLLLPSRVDALSKLVALKH